jgi:hypothetical protein
MQMTKSPPAGGAITWVLCIPDPGNPHRIVPYLHENRGAVWFSELPFADRYLRENPALPRGSRSKAVVGIERLLTFAVDLLKAGIRTVFTDLEYGRENAGESLSAVAARLEAGRAENDPTPILLSKPKSAR